MRGLLCGLPVGLVGLDGFSEDLLLPRYGRDMVKEEPGQPEGAVDLIGVQVVVERLPGVDEAVGVRGKATSSWRHHPSSTPPPGERYSERGGEEVRSLIVAMPTTLPRPGRK